MRRWENKKSFLWNVSIKWQSITLLCVGALLINVRKYREAVNDLSAPRIINTNYSRLEREAGQLPVHLTSFPPVAVTALFILCFFLYESICHEHFKRLALQFALNSLSLSHLSWFPCVWKAVQSSLAHTGTHQHPRDPLSSPPRMHSCFSALHLLESLFLCR